MSPFRTLEISGQTWAEFYFDDPNYRVAFPEFGSFDINRETGCIQAHPLAGTAPETLNHILDHHIRPLSRSLLGTIVMHSSAVSLGETTLAFAGPSGSGKSSLALALAQRGHEFLADDILDISDSGGGYVAHPGLPYFRICEDAKTALVREEQVLPNDVDYNPKYRIQPGKNIRQCSAAKSITRIFLLNRTDDTTISFHPVTGGDKLVAIMENCFHLGHGDAEHRGEIFDRISRFSDGIMLERIDYPSDYGAINDVCDAVLQKVSLDHEN